MHFSKIFIAAALICGCVTMAHSQYLRKKLKPAFFIPENELDYQEKLPPIVPSQAIYNTIKKLSVDDNGQSAALTQGDETLIQDSFSDNTPILDEQQHPDYKEKYDDYLKDLAVIGQTGKIPFNKTLEEDLKKMNSNSAFVVK